jgi:hypothetical protein
MKHAGLCFGCAHDNKCVLTSRIPVLQCEEFGQAIILDSADKNLRRLSGKASKAAQASEDTVEE